MESSFRPPSRTFFNQSHMVRQPPQSFCSFPVKCSKLKSPRGTLNKSASWLQECLCPFPDIQRKKSFISRSLLEFVPSFQCPFGIFQEKSKRFELQPKRCHKRNLWVFYFFEDNNRQTTYLYDLISIAQMYHPLVGTIKRWTFLYTCVTSQ